MADNTVGGTGRLDPAALAKLAPKVEPKPAPAADMATNPNGTPANQAVQPPARMAADRRAKTGPLTALPGSFDFDAPTTPAQANPAQAQANAAATQQQADAKAETPALNSTADNIAAARNLTTLGKVIAGLPAAANVASASDTGATVVDSLNSATDVVNTAVEALAKPADAVADTAAAVAKPADALADAAKAGESTPLSKGMGIAAMAAGGMMTISAATRMMNGDISTSEGIAGLAEGVGTMMTGVGDALGKTMNLGGGAVTAMGAVAGVGNLALGAVALSRGANTLAEGKNPDGTPLDAKNTISAGLDMAGGALAMAAGAAWLVPGGQPVALALSVAAAGASLMKLAVDNAETIAEYLPDGVNKALAATAQAVAPGVVATGKAVAAAVNGVTSLASSAWGWLSGGNNSPPPAQPAGS